MVVAVANVTPPLAFAAGLASFLSPCVLPLVPAYLAYLTGRAAQPVAATGPGAALATASGTIARPVVRSELAASGVAFVVGLSLIFTLFFYALASVLTAQMRAVLVPVAGLLVILMALQTAGLIRIPLLMREFRLANQAPSQSGPLGGFLLGVSFAAGWTPCIGATLGAVATSGIAQGTTADGLLLMVAYCLGLGLPFLAMALAFERAAPAVRALNRHRRVIDLASAAVLLLMGFLLLTNNLLFLTQQLARILPGWLLTPFGL